MTGRITFVQCKRCFQESLHQVIELPAHHAALAQCQATKGQRNACVDLEQQRMRLPTARFLRQQENRMPPIESSDSTPIKKNSRFQEEQKSIILRGIPMQLQDQGQLLQGIPLDKSGDYRQRRHQPACSMLQPPELSYLQRLPLCICKRWFSHRTRGSNTVDRGKHMGWPFGRLAQRFKTITKFLDSKYHEKFPSCLHFCKGDWRKGHDVVSRR